VGNAHSILPPYRCPYNPKTSSDGGVVFLQITSTQKWATPTRFCRRIDAPTIRKLHPTAELFFRKLQALKKGQRPTKA
jgi:hypothetical protein